MAPITAEQPCGQDLEDTALLASFDAFRLFGQSTALDAPSEPGESRVPKPLESPEWVDIRDQALDALGKSKDLRLLTCLGTAVLRTDGIPAFTETLKTASQWLDTYWTQTFPLVDGDGLLRRNVLNCFADQWAVLDALRRLPLVSSRQHGKVSLRDIEIATGQAPNSGDATVDEAKINAAFADMPIEQLQALQASTATGLAAVKSIGVKMGTEIGSEALPAFDGLTASLTKIDRVLRSQFKLRRGGDEPGTEAVEAQAAAAETGARPVGAIRSRDDAIRALDAVAEFFRRNEPSSPIPLLVDRAKRLVSKDFLEVLADVAPDALGQARAAGGLKPGE